MSLKKQLNMVNGFLFEHSGYTFKLLDEQADKKLFTPSRSAACFFYRAATVVTAPVFFSVIAIEAVASCLFNLFRSIYDLVACSSSEALKDLKKSGTALYAVFLFAVVAVLSPLINLVDFVGGGVANLMGSNDEPQQSMFQGI